MPAKASASPATLLRLTRQIKLPQPTTPRVLAIDDFAFRKGRTYGTLLVDGEDHRPLDLLPERNATVVADRLRQHPGVQIITRDRATEYARGATDGAPDALQVLDRWHLIGNLQEALVRLLDRLRSQLQGLLSTTSGSIAPLSIYERDRRRGTKDQARHQNSRARRYGVYAEVKELHRQGRNILQLARQLRISRQTVRRYIGSEPFLEWAERPRGASILDPYVTHLQQRWDAGCRTNKQLYAEVLGLGYRGSIRQLAQWTRLRRDLAAGGQRQYGRREARKLEVFVAADTAPPAKPDAKLPGTQSLAWLLLSDEGSLPADKQRLLGQLKAHDELARGYDLGQQFLRMLRGRWPDHLGAWLQACLGCGLKELETFATGLEREVQNLQAAVELPYSNGPAEGNVTRLKQIRRAMYGRGNFDLLKIRVLVAA